MKAITEDNKKINVNEISKFVLGNVANIAGKGENVVISIFTFSLNVFKRFLCYGSLNLGLCGKGLTKFF